MRRAQAERSRTHARTRTRRKKSNTQADANEEEPKHLRHDAHKDKPQTIFVPSFNEAIKREHQQNAKKDEAETSRHALLLLLLQSRLFAYRDFNLFATMWANNVRFLFAGFILEEISNTATDNICNPS